MNSIDPPGGLVLNQSPVIADNNVTEVVQRPDIYFGDFLVVEQEIEVETSEVSGNAPRVSRKHRQRKRHRKRAGKTVNDTETSEKRGRIVKKKKENKSESSSSNSIKTRKRPHTSKTGKNVVEHGEKKKKKTIPNQIINPWAKIVADAEKVFQKNCASESKVTPPTAEEIELLMNISNVREFAEENAVPVVVDTMPVLEIGQNQEALGDEAEMMLASFNTEESTSSPKANMVPIVVDTPSAFETGQAKEPGALLASANAPNEHEVEMMLAASNTEEPTNSPKANIVVDTPSDFETGHNQTLLALPNAPNVHEGEMMLTSFNTEESTNSPKANMVPVVVVDIPSASETGQAREPGALLAPANAPNVHEVEMMSTPETKESTNPPKANMVPIVVDTPSAFETGQAKEPGALLAPANAPNVHEVEMMSTPETEEPTSSVEVLPMDTASAQNQEDPDALKSNESASSLFFTYSGKTNMVPSVDISSTLEIGAEQSNVFAPAGHKDALMLTLPYTEKPIESTSSSTSDESNDPIALTVEWMLTVLSSDEPDAIVEVPSTSEGSSKAVQEKRGRGRPKKKVRKPPSKKGPPQGSSTKKVVSSEKPIFVGSRLFYALRKRNTHNGDSMEDATSISINTPSTSEEASSQDAQIKPIVGEVVEKKRGRGRPKKRRRKPNGQLAPYDTREANTGNVADIIVLNASQSSQSPVPEETPDLVEVFPIIEDAQNAPLALDIRQIQSVSGSNDVLSNSSSNFMNHEVPSTSQVVGQVVEKKRGRGRPKKKVCARKLKQLPLHPDDDPRQLFAGRRAPDVLEPVDDVPMKGVVEGLPELGPVGDELPIEGIPMNVDHVARVSISEPLDDNIALAASLTSPLRSNSIDADDEDENEKQSSSST